MKSEPDKQSLNIASYDSLDQLEILKEICHQLYIARNITFDHDSIQEALKRIDILFRDTENYN